jgi:hypothetical protein
MAWNFGQKRPAIWAVEMNDFSVRALLAQLPYFAGVADSSLNELAQQAVRCTFAANEMLFLEGERSAGLWVVEYGRIKAYKLSPDGREYILRFFGPGDTFNDLAALDNAPNAASATAVTDVVAWVIPTAVFTAALQTDHQLALAVLHGLVGRVRELVGRVEDLAARSSLAWLAFCWNRRRTLCWLIRPLPAPSLPITWPPPQNPLAALCASWKKRGPSALTATASSLPGQTPCASLLNCNQSWVRRRLLPCPAPGKGVYRWKGRQIHPQEAPVLPLNSVGFLLLGVMVHRGPGSLTVPVGSCVDGESLR